MADGILTSVECVAMFADILTRGRETLYDKLEVRLRVLEKWFSEIQKLAGNGRVMNYFGW